MVGGGRGGGVEVGREEGEWMEVDGVGCRAFVAFVFV